MVWLHFKVVVSETKTQCTHGVSKPVSGWVCALPPLQLWVNEIHYYKRWAAWNQRLAVGCCDRRHSSMLSPGLRCCRHSHKVVFFHRLSGMRSRGRMGCLWFGVFWHSQSMTKCSSWMALTDGGGSRPKGQWKTQKWQSVWQLWLTSRPSPLRGRSFEIQGEVSRGYDEDRNLGKDRLLQCSRRLLQLILHLKCFSGISNDCAPLVLCRCWGLLQPWVLFSYKNLSLSDTALAPGARELFPHILIFLLWHTRKKPRLARSQGWSLVCSRSHSSLSGRGACQGSKEVFQSWLSCSHWNKGMETPAGWGQKKVRLVQLYWLHQGQIFSIKCWGCIVFIIRHRCSSWCKRLHISVLRGAGQNHVPTAFYSTQSSKKAQGAFSQIATFLSHPADGLSALHPFIFCIKGHV